MKKIYAWSSNGDKLVFIKLVNNYYLVWNKKNILYSEFKKMSEPIDLFESFINAL